MKTVKGTVLCCMSISLAIVALGCGNAENERMEQESRKIKRIPHHTNEWRDAK